MQPFLLVSDIDNTLLGNDAATARFAGFFHDSKPAMRLAFSSGRFYESQLDSVRNTALPLPDAMIGGVGTDIRFPPHGEVLEAWHQHIRTDWHLQRLRQCLRGVDGLELQPEEFQSAYKLSYYYHNAGNADLAALEQRVQEAGLRVRLIYSSNRDLDLLPPAADKGLACAFLARHLGIPPQRVFVAGDSGNDLALFQQGFRGIVVANAHEELRALDGPEVYQAQKRYADGVVEGLKYWLARQ